MPDKDRWQQISELNQNLLNQEAKRWLRLAQQQPDHNNSLYVFQLALWGLEQKSLQFKSQDRTNQLQDFVEGLQGEDDQEAALGVPSHVGRPGPGGPTGSGRAEPPASARPGGCGVGPDRPVGLETVERPKHAGDLPTGPAPSESTGLTPPESAPQSQEEEPPEAPPPLIQERRRINSTITITMSPSPSLVPGFALSLTTSQTPLY